MDQLCVDTIRTLSMDAVEKAASGHPGTPMALAPVIYTLWQRFLRYDPADANWPNRDRFVLSNGHASMLLYSMLHLAGVRDVGARHPRPGELAVTLEDIKRFRQIGSRCPGHPEYGHTAGVEATTGPLGQGCGMSVGMAIAERWLAQHFNRPGFAVFDYDVYAMCSDGDMMEGVTSEAASLAGHLMLGNLCWIYDSNRVTIEGHTDLAFSDDVAARFLACGWNVQRVGDANDMTTVAQAIDTFRNTHAVPTLLIVESHIGYGAPHKQDTSAAHGEPLGEEEIRLAKRSYGWPEDTKFLVPDGVREHFHAGIGERGRELREAWLERMEAYRTKYPDLSDQIRQMQTGDLPKGWDSGLPSFAADAKGLASRDSSAKVLNAIAMHYPWLAGGSADLAPSTKTRLTFEAAGDFEADKYGGRNFHFGVREHAMGAIVNGLTLSKLRAYGSTFLIFSDYMKPAIRLGALMKLPSVYIFTHDSIGLGQDGPTHQPVEQLVALRSIPGLITVRPADANEFAEAWRTNDA
jgi:transketolase